MSWKEKLKVKRVGDMSYACKQVGDSLTSGCEQRSRLS